MSLPGLIVHFDDGEDVKLEPLTRDLALAERAYGIDFSGTDGTENYLRVYASALAAMNRLKRRGDLTRDLPESLEDLMDVADIEVIAGDDPEGKGADPAASTGP